MRAKHDSLAETQAIKVLGLMIGRWVPRLGIFDSLSRNASMTHDSLAETQATKVLG